MVLLISYDLNGKERPAAYAAVKKKIETKASAFIRPLYSQWFVETAESPDNWVTYLQKDDTVDKTDSLFVLKVTKPYQGLLSEDQWAWLRARI